VLMVIQLIRISNYYYIFIDSHQMEGRRAFLLMTFLKELKCMINKHKLYSMTFVSAAILLMLISITDAAPFAYITNNNHWAEHIGTTVSVIDTATNKVSATVNVGESPYGVAVTSNGKKVYVTNMDSGDVSVIDTAKNKVIATVPVGYDPTGIAVTPDGKKVYVVNEFNRNGTISVIDTANNKVTTTIAVGKLPEGIAVTPDGNKVYVANELSNNVSVIDTATNKVSATVNVGTSPNGVAVAPDGKKVYVTNDELINTTGAVSVINTVTNKVTSTVNVEDGPFGVAVTPDGKNVYVTSKGSNNVSVIDTATNTIAATVPVGDATCGVAVTPDGANVYVVKSGEKPIGWNSMGEGYYVPSTVAVINTTTNKVTTNVTVGTLPVAFGKFIGGNIQKAKLNSSKTKASLSRHKQKKVSLQKI
jgi:YVTN family beta-propeller protein